MAAPRRSPSSPAEGEICAACGVRISDDQLVVKGLTSGSKRAGPIQFHVLCFELWNEERCKPRDMTAPLRPGQETSMQVKCSKCLQLIAISDDGLRRFGLIARPKARSEPALN